MAYLDFRSLMYSLENIGVLDVLLPFMLVFTIVFATLQKTKILGKDDKDRPRKNYNVIVSLVMGLAVIIPHVTQAYRPETDPVNIINTAIPTVSIVLVAIIMVLLVIGAFGKRMDIGESKVGGWFTVLAILIVVVIFLAATNVFDRAYLPSWLYFLYDPNFQALVVAIIVFGILIGWVTKDDKSDERKDRTSLFDEFRKTLK